MTLQACVYVCMFVVDILSGNNLFNTVFGG